MQRQVHHRAAASTRISPIGTSYHHNRGGSSVAHKSIQCTNKRASSCVSRSNLLGTSPQRQSLCLAASSSSAPVSDERIPVTVITGFLGSGKTTLLNSLLTQPHGKRIAVIENEFGEIDIDSELVAKQETLEGTMDTITQLSNGCLCCTVRDDLIQALNNLWLRRKESAIDHIVIETTGLANPAPIISSFFMDADLPDRVRLDGVVTVVDAKNVSRHLDEEKGEGVVNEAMEQVAYADRILLNKVDLVTNPSQLSALEARLRGINEMADIKRSTKSVVDVDFVLGVGGFDLASVEKQLNERLHDHSHDHSHSHDHDHDHDHDCKGEKCTHESHSHSHSAPEFKQAPEFKHDDKVSSVSLILDGDMDLDKINYSLGFLLESRAEDIFRMKGILSIAGSDYRFVYQGVHEMFEGVPDRKWHEGEKRNNRLVFIGRYLDKEDFTEAFKGCLAGVNLAETETATAV